MTGLNLQFEVPVVGILRGVEGSFFREVMQASFSAGLQFLEITMNTEGAAGIVSRCRPEVPDGKWLGVGTVRNLEEARIAVDAGAMFMVTPNTETAVIEYGRGKDIPVIAGAFTPTEVYILPDHDLEIVLFQVGVSTFGRLVTKLPNILGADHLVSAVSSLLQTTRDRVTGQATKFVRRGQPGESTDVVTAGRNITHQPGPRANSIRSHPRISRHINSVLPNGVIQFRLAGMFR